MGSPERPIVPGRLAREGRNRKGLGFRVSCLGFGVSGLGFRVWGLGFGV